MLAKLENLGPFQFFFTLSCGDSRWDENFSSILKSLKIKIKYEFDSKGFEQTKVLKKEDDREIEIDLRTYLNDYVNKSKHELIRTNILNATRNYNQRVKAFIKGVVMDKSNPMSVKHYSTKVEFQGRGAGHNHGTLWVDLKKMEYFFEKKNGDWTDFNSIILEMQDSEVKKISEKRLKNGVKYLLFFKYQETNENHDEENTGNKDLDILTSF